MKNLVAILSILVLVPVVAFAAHGAQAPEGQDELTAVSEATQPVLFATPETLLSDGPHLCETYPQYIDCDHWTDQYCTYEWNSCRGCCEATYIAPGAACPDICQ